jgi:hypothetical protein
VEEFLIAVIQFLFETVIEALIYWPFETATDRWFGFTFTLAFVLVRFTWGER